MALVCAGVWSAAAQLPRPTEISVDAKARVFPEVTNGLRALQRDASGRYYALVAKPSAEARGSQVLVFDAEGKKIREIPPASELGDKNALIRFGGDMDVDAAGGIYIADQGGNAVRILDREGSLVKSVGVGSPISVAVLENGEFAVAGLASKKLISVYDSAGKLEREFGEPAELAERETLNRSLNVGRLARDAAGHVYFAFTYLPEPTVRKYDAFGYLIQEARVTSLEVQPTAQAVRREIGRLEIGSGNKPRVPPVLNAVAVDNETQQIWVASAGLLLVIDRDGNQRMIYRVFTPEGARIEASAILVEPKRLLVGSEEQGIYEFARPDKGAR